MDMGDNTHPWDNVNEVRLVLDFLVQAACWPPYDAREIVMRPDALSGLANILMACSAALERADEANSKGK